MSANWSKWINQLYTGLTPNYSYSLFESGAQWTYDDPAFGDPVPAGAYDLNTLNSNNITLTAASSNKLGFSFNPASVSSLYLIRAQIQLQSSANWIAGRIWDGTNVIAYGNTLSMTMEGFYAPGTLNEVQITVQLANNTGGVVVYDPSALTSAAIFSVTQLK